MTVLATERLIVRQPQIEDASAIADYYKRNRAFHKKWDPTRSDEFFTTSYWKTQLPVILAANGDGRQIDFFVALKSDPTHFIGKISFSSITRGAFHACLLGYAIDEQMEGQGYMTEALTEAIRYAFEVENLHRIMANYIPTNMRSAALLARLGFEKEGVARDYLRIDGRWQDHILTSLTNTHWKPV